MYDQFLFSLLISLALMLKFTFLLFFKKYKQDYSMIAGTSFFSALYSMFATNPDFVFHPIIMAFIVLSSFVIAVLYKDNLIGFCKGLVLLYYIFVAIALFL